jgi:aryl-alcohol dehydrogenase-like predicted oxidoreductase
MSQSRVILGLWPLAGITTAGVTEPDAQQTMISAIDHGIDTFDTAFSYGYEGEMDRLLGSFVRDQRDRFTIIGKVGQRWTHDRKRMVDGSRDILTRDTEISLQRIGIEQFDLLMLHSPDSKVPIERSAEAMASLQQRGLSQRIGVCNVDPSQLRRFRQAANCDAIQCPLNLMQRSSLQELIPQCAQQRCDVYVFWVLMKGLLAGRMSRSHVFSEGDSRPSYGIFQGDARRRAHDVLDGMHELAISTGLSIAQLSIGWVLSQDGVTAALVGARRPDQVREIAHAKPLSEDVAEAVDAIVEKHT